MYKIKPKTLFIGKNVIYLPSCHSTNDIAAEIIQKGEAYDGTVVITSHQTAGRGQRGNLWEALPDQNLTFSIILKPSFILPINQFQLNIAISLGINDFLQSFLLPDTRIKWPNDIYVQNKKLGGVLIESSLIGSKLNHSIVGIGLNINQLTFENPNATSLAQLTTKQFPDLSSLLEKLLETIEKRYIQLRQGETANQRTDYLRRLFRINEWHQFIVKEKSIEAKICGISPYGLLLLEHPLGEQFAYDLKEITYVL